MKHLILYPDALRLLKFGGAGVVLLTGGLSLLSGAIAGLMVTALGAFLTAWGLALMVQTARVMARWRPCFEADSGGFSVMGQPKLPWSDYHSVCVSSRRISRWTLTQSLKIRIGTGPRSRSVSIPALHLPGRASGAASVIENYGYAMLDPAARTCALEMQPLILPEQTAPIHSTDLWGQPEAETLIPLLDTDGPAPDPAPLPLRARIRAPEPDAEPVHVFSSRRRRLETAA